jgi:SAM-dependent methyltransferase
LEVKAGASVFDRLKQGFLAYHHRSSRVPQGQRVVASLARHLDRARSLLDVGCGDGTNTLALARAIGAETVAGVDVAVRATAVVPVRQYDGVHLPFPDRSFEAVSIVDVLHHCTEPRAVLGEALRVADRVLVIKDHFAFGPLTHRMLYWMDIAGNARDGTPSPGTYFEPAQWVDMIGDAGGRIVALDWPLKTHDLPWRIVGWPQLQFTAKVVRA